MTNGSFRGNRSENTSIARTTIPADTDILTSPPSRLPVSPSLRLSVAPSRAHPELRVSSASSPERDSIVAVVPEPACWVALDDKNRFAERPDSADESDDRVAGGERGSQVGANLEPPGQGRRTILGHQLVDVGRDCDEGGRRSGSVGRLEARHAGDGSRVARREPTQKPVADLGAVQRPGQVQAVGRQTAVETGGELGAVTI